MFAALPRLPRDDAGPVFAEPWQARAFALAVRLSAQGHFTWSEWATALAVELDAATRRADPDDGSYYYEHWLAALERVVTAKRLAKRRSFSIGKMLGPRRIGTPRTAKPCCSMVRGRDPRNATAAQPARERVRPAELAGYLRDPRLSP